MHEQEIENLKDQLNDKDILLNKLKNIHKQVIKHLKDQLILDLKKSNQQPKSSKRADQEPKSRKRAGQQGKGFVNLPVLLSKLNINSSNN